MNRKQTLEMLRAARVFNDHGIAKVTEGLRLQSRTDLVGVYVGYAGQVSRLGPPSWQVIRAGFKTDPEGHWSNRGHKTFLLPYGRVREEKEPTRFQAIAWASERYNFDPEDWVPSPFGRASGWFPRPVLEIALDAIQRGARLSQKDDSYIPAAD